jgi:hypothetical protein
MRAALALILGVVAGCVLLYSNASAEWWRKNLEQHSYNANTYVSTGHIIESRCDLEKGYSSRIIFENALDSKVRSLGYNDSDVRDIAYRVISFTQDKDNRDFASGICRIEILFFKDNIDDTPRAVGEALSSQSNSELFSPQTGHSSFPQTGAR